MRWNEYQNDNERQLCHTKQENSTVMKITFDPALLGSEAKGLGSSGGII